MSGEVRPVAVTGIGLCTPLGNSAGDHWTGVINGRRAVRRLEPQELTGSLSGDEVPGSLLPGWDGWTGARLGPSPRERLASVSDVVGWAEHAAVEAREQAGLLWPSGERRDRMGVVFGASKPVLSPWFDLPPAGWLAMPPGTVREPVDQLPAAAEAIARTFDLRGPLLTPCAACATGLVSIIRGVELIRDGACDVVIAGSADSSIHPAYLAAYRRMGVLAAAGDDPAASCRPFDRCRRGFAVGEGVAVLVLEGIDHARDRGATVLAEILGAGLTSDNDSLVDVDPAGQSLARALGDALKRSGVRPREIDAASLHGTGTRLNDLCETNALKQALGERARGVSCFSLKGAIGHLMGAAGSVETATLIQAMQQGIVPATVNLEEPDPACDLDYTPRQARTRPINTAVKLSLGFGGTCAALVLRSPQTH